jgi:hypothetical protein
MAEGHIKDLHAQLQIAPAEETQWAPVAKAMRENAAETDKAIDKRKALVNSANAVDNLSVSWDCSAAAAFI